MVLFGALILVLGILFTLAGIFQLIASTNNKNLKAGAMNALLIGGVFLLLGGTLCTKAY